MKFCALLAIFCSGCTSSYSFKPAVYDIVYESKYNSEQSGLKFDRAGIVLLSPNSQEIIIGYNVTHPFEIAEARKMMVNLVEEALEEINEKDIAAPYLSEYPYPLHCLSLRISLTGEQHSGDLSYVLLLNGDIFYFQNTEESLVRDIVLEETFVEAYTKVHFSG